MSRTVDVTVTYKVTRIWPATMLVRACRVLRYVVGTERAARWAINGVRRLLGLRIVKTEFR